MSAACTTETIARITGRSRKLREPVSVETSGKTASDSHEISGNVLAALESAGVSRFLIEAAQVDPETVGADHNTARSEILKFTGWAEEEGGEVTDYLNYGSGYFRSLCDVRRPVELRGVPADTENAKILRSLYPEVFA